VGSDCIGGARREVRSCVERLSALVWHRTGSTVSPLRIRAFATAFHRRCQLVSVERLQRALDFEEHRFVLPSDEELRSRAKESHEWWLRSGEEEKRPPRVDPWCWDVYGETGWIYVAQLLPECLPTRLKLGYSINLYGRLKSYRTSAPNVHFVGLWPSNTAHERGALAALVGRKGHIIGGEVVEVPDIPAGLDRVSAYLLRPNLRARIPASGDWISEDGRIDDAADRTRMGRWPGPALP
jgi:hypothetical protein